jgi:hypothetical protein
MEHLGGAAMSPTAISRDDIAVLQTIWSDLKITGPIPKPSQFATWLRLYPIDVVADGLNAGLRWLSRTKTQPDEAFIRYVSACMRNIKQLRDLDEEFADE